MNDKDALIDSPATLNASAEAGNSSRAPAGRLRARLRPWMKSIHSWLGLIVGLFITLVSLTGSVIVFRPAIERSMLPGLPGGSFTDRRAGLDDTVARIEEKWPGAQVRIIRFPATPGDPYIIQVLTRQKRLERIVSDSSSGRVLGVLDTRWLNRVIDLHRNLFWERRVGRKVVGVIGALLVVLSATGVVLWWLGARRWRSLASLPGRSSTQRSHFDLHRLTGIWAYLRPDGPCIYGGLHFLP
jgi:uncharacterized iron-regulated membrane protein